MYVIYGCLLKLYVMLSLTLLRCDVHTLLQVDSVLDKSVDSHIDKRVLDNAKKANTVIVI